MISMLKDNREKPTVASVLDIYLRNLVLNELVAPLIQRVSGMTTNPLPRRMNKLIQLVQAHPKVLVLH